MKEKICGIYCIENLLNGKKYIGQTIDFNHRISSHISNIKNKRGRSHLYYAIYKHGLENFSFYIIEKCERELLNEREIYYIGLYKTIDSDFGYNMSEGGDTPPSWLGKKHRPQTIQKMIESHPHLKTWLGKFHTQETKDKISKANIGKQKSQETKDKISKANKGKTGYLKGKHLSKETKLKISMAKKGKKLSEEHKKRISEGGKGKTRSKESIEKTSVKLRRIKNKSTSVYFGVSYKKRDKSWVSQISLNKKKIYIAQVKTEIIAAKRYDEYIIKNNLVNLFPLNFPKGNR